MKQKPTRSELGAARRDVVHATEAPLPAERAFVIQLRAQAGPKEDPFIGRAEHIASGRSERFTNAAELIEFIAAVLLAPPRGGS